MSCDNLRAVFSRIECKWRTICRMERKPRHLVISAPFDFKEGPAVNFPGYSADDISLMKEKAIASTAVTDDGRSDDLTPPYQRPRSRASSYSCGFGGRVGYHARKVSQGCLH